MTKLNQLILNIQGKVRRDRSLSVLLGSIASGEATTKDVNAFQSFVRRLFYLAEFSGYKWQSEVVRRLATVQGIREIAARSITRADGLTEKLVDTIEKRPEVAGFVRDAVLGQSAIYQGVTEGQLLSAEEYGLGFKRWIHLGMGATDREWHVSMNGVTIPRDEKFQLSTGVSVDSTHDWNNAGAGEWVNCSCQTVYLPNR